MNPENLLKLTKVILSLKATIKCPICLDFVENAIQLGCSHQFCNNCLQEHRSQNFPLCPVCKIAINKRCAVYKDHFADELSKFVNRASQLIKETYAHEVDELITNADKLQAIIDTAPQDVGSCATSNKIPQPIEFKKPHDAFDKLIGQPKCYVNKKRQAGQKPMILSFSNSDNRTKIVNWLNDNQQKLDTFTQTPSFLSFSDDEADFELPSISQVPFRKQRHAHRLRSQSLTLSKNLNEPLVRRYHSLTQGLNDDDYDIEEVHSETLVKQVERKVLQDMLEDECLANLEHLAQRNKDKLKKDKATPKKGKKSLNTKQHSNIPNSGSSSGWDRIKSVKKSIKRAAKEPKKLNISLQETGSMKESLRHSTKISPMEKTTMKVKKLPKKNTRESSTTKTPPTTEKPLRTSTRIDNKENENCRKKVDSTVDDQNEHGNNVFNLSAVEKYFERNLTKIKITPEKNVSSDMEIDVIKDTIKYVKDSVKDSPVQNRTSVDKQNTSAKDKSVDEEEVFLLPTQKTPNNSNPNTLCYVAPVPTEFNDIDIIASCLTNNLECCISSATSLKNDVAFSLVACFTNLKTYIDKIMKHRCKNKEQEMQTRQVIQKNIATQTKNVFFSSMSTQTMSPLVKKSSIKSIQTSQIPTHNAEAQTDVAPHVDQDVQTVKDLSTTRSTEEKSLERVITKSSKGSLDCKDTGKASMQKRSLTAMYEMESPYDEEEKISAKTSKSSKVDNPERHISADSSKLGKSKSSDPSQESVLICTLKTTASHKSDNKVNRKLVYEDALNRTFKRIRQPASDSESDGDGMPTKRRLMRDDLTIKFVETQKESKENSQNKTSTPESEKIDYDKYLLDVMAKYGTPPPKRTQEDEQQDRHEIKSDKLSNSRKRNGQESSDSHNKKSQLSQKDCQKDSGDHVFTAHIAFEENLAKFDKEIFEHEHIGKTHSTECDLVENTPILSPKPKIPRLHSSIKKKETKKDFMKEPLQILSKGSASSDAFKSRKPLDEERVNELTEKELSTLNRNIENLPSQTERCTVDVAGILEELRNDEDFFKSNMECDEKEQENNLSKTKGAEVLDNDFPMDDLLDGAIAGKNDNGDQEGLNITQENIDKVVENLNGFEDDDLIEAELEKISFTAEQRKLRENERHRIQILQNVKLKSQDKQATKSPFDNGIIESSDLSDEEIVETTPQKRKNNSRDRSLVDLQIDEFENNSLDMDFCLPPPPGFGNDDNSGPVPDDARESSPNDIDFRLLKGNKSSLTPDSLSNFIVTPDTMMHKEIATAASQNENSQYSLTFKPSSFTPNRLVKNKNSVIHCTPRISQTLAPDTADISSPISKSTIKFSQTKYTPLVSTSRLSTKRSSLMTSTPNQKSILNYVKASQDSLSQQKPKPCIMWSRIVNKDLNVFTQLEVKKLVTTSASFNPRVTHLIVLVDEKGQIVSHTAKMLVAIAAGIWVVRYEWAQDCLKLNRIVSEEPYEALDTSGVPGPQISRLTRETKPLFKGFRFYCAPPLLTIARADLENILQLSGGEISRTLDDFLNQDAKVNIILTESSASEDAEQFENLLHAYKAVTIDVEWLTRCIGQYKLVSFRAFLVSGDDSNICDLGYPPTLVESVPFTLTEAM